MMPYVPFKRRVNLAVAHDRACRIDEASTFGVIAFGH
jgi:hypothetical protein